MKLATMRIRKIENKDNQRMKEIIHESFSELGAETDGVSINDPEMDDIYSAYNRNNSGYWVIVDGNDTVLGGGGYLPLKGAGNIAEVQKFFLDKSIRGQGYGSQVLECILESARKNKYKGIYLEVLDCMKVASKLYEKYGFKHCKRMGNTGHYSCNTFMYKGLQ